MWTYLPTILNFAGIAQGLNFLHTLQPKPLVHRDVKPANILLDKGNIPKLADFGLLRKGVSGEGDTNTETMNVAGTNVYMAPESMRGDVSAKMDVWSFGVVLLEILTNIAVFDKDRYVFR